MIVGAYQSADAPTPTQSRAAAASDDDQAGSDPAGADPRQPVGDAAAQREPATAEHQDHDDHQERHRVGDALPVLGSRTLAPVRGHRLGGADEQAAEQRQRVGPEAAQERGGEGRR